MIKHHPDFNMLIEHSAGALDWALALAVSAHVHHCDHCKQQLHTLNRVGGNLLCGTQTQSLSPNLLDNVLNRIENNAKSALPVNNTNTAQAVQPKNPGVTTVKHIEAPNKLPKPVIKAIEACGSKLQWKSISSSLKSAQLPLMQDKYEVAFHKIKAGGTVVEHGHKGLEITVVLEGSFSDENGIYSVGDFLVRQPGHVHRPTATRDNSCLCLSVLAAPIALTGFWGKLINPFLSFRPA